MSNQGFAGGRLRSISAWALQLALGGFFIFAGSLKLAGTPDMVALFEQIAVGQWFRFVTGIIEVVGGLALFIPVLVPLAGPVLAATLVGALLTHLVILQTSFLHVFIFAIPLLVLIWLRRDQAAAWLQRFHLTAA